MDKAIFIAVIGPATNTNDAILELAKKIGEFIALNGWILLSGGRDKGIMEATNEGAYSAGGMTVGVLPGDGNEKSKYVKIPIVTGMGSARNNIIALTADLLVAISMGFGTSSEISLALKAGKTVIIARANQKTKDFFSDLGKDRIIFADNLEEVKLNLLKHFTPK